MSRGTRKSAKLAELARGSVDGVVAPEADYAPIDLLPAGQPGKAPSRLPVADLRYYEEQQPRDMLLSQDWTRLVAEARNDPAGVLAALERAAAERAESRRVLDHVDELAASIASEGVLMPLLVVRLGDEYVVVDGHCRAMGAVRVGLDEVPVHIEEAADDLDGRLTIAAHRFVLNETQERLSPLEAMREVVRLMELAQQVAEYAVARSEPATEMAAVLASVDSSDGGGVAAEDRIADVGVRSAKLRPGQTRARLQQRAARDLVLRRTGLSEDRFETLYRLRHLHPDAQALASGLGESHLRVLLSTPSEAQPLLVRLVKMTHATVAQTEIHCKWARLRGVEYVEKLYERELRQAEAGPQRASVSWQKLLNAIPNDLTKRVSALRAELEALPEAQRTVRLSQLARQRDLCAEATRAFDEILQQHAEPVAGHKPTWSVVVDQPSDAGPPTPGR